MADPLGFLDNRAAALAALFDTVLAALDATVWVLDTDLVCRFSTGSVPQLTGANTIEVRGGCSAAGPRSKRMAWKRVPWASCLACSL